VESLEELLDEEIRPVRVRLEHYLRSTDPTVLTMVRAKIIEKSVDEFNPKTKRPPYPVSRTVYWEPADDRAEQSPSHPLEEAP
jgi:hypothetical protein